MTNLKQLTIKELKQFISENRTDDDKCSAALGELLTRDPDGPLYPPNMSTEEMQRVFQEKFEQVKLKS